MMNSLSARNESERSARQRSPILKTRPPAGYADVLAGLNVVVDWTRREVCRRGGHRCKLSAREAALLACLARKAGTPVSRDEILSQVWQLDPLRTATRTIDMHVSLLRRKLDDQAQRPSVLVTVHGVGYMLHPGAISWDDARPCMNERENGQGAVTTAGESLSVV